MKYISLFVAAIYNIYNISFTKGDFNGVYDSERSIGKMGNRSTPGTGALCTGKIPGAFHFRVTWAIPIDAVKPKDGRFKSSKTLM